MNILHLIRTTFPEITIRYEGSNVCFNYSGNNVCMPSENIGELEPIIRKYL